MIRPHAPKPFIRFIRITFTSLFFVLVVLAGAATSVVGFSVRTVEDLAKNLVAQMSDKGLPAVIDRAKRARLSRVNVPLRDEPWGAAAATGTFGFRPDRPTLIVLVHGATRAPSPGSDIGTLEGARLYWGYDYVRELLGGGPVLTLSGARLDLKTWQQTATSNAHPGDHILTSPGGLPKRFVALLHRDGSRFLGPQTEAMVTQLDVLYRHLEAKLGEAPQLILLAHSMGGLVSRYLLSDPSSRQPEFEVSLRARRQAAFLRDRTLYLVTLATPHLGSKAADDVLVMQQATALTGAVRKQFGLSRDHDPQQTAMAFLRAFQPSTQHLRSDALAALNRPTRGLLAPQFARRGDNSLVPIYTLSGRSPGGTYFENPNSDFGLELALLLLEGERQNLGTKTRTDTLSMLFSDYLLYNFPGLNSGWGEVPDDLAFLDKVSRTPAFGSFGLSVPRSQDDAAGTLEFESFPVIYQRFTWHMPDGTPPSLSARLDTWLDALTEGALEPPDLTPVIADLPPGATLGEIRSHYLADKPVKVKPLPAAASDGFIDGDGVVSLDSGLGLYLGTSTPDYFSHDRTWEVGSVRERGSWYRIYDDRYPTEKDGYFPWEWGNHSFMQYQPGVAVWLRDQVISRAGPYVGQGVVSQWKRASKK